jgi:hypothetical protein
MGKLLKPAIGGIAGLAMFASMSGTAWAGTDAVVNLYHSDGRTAGNGHFQANGDRIRACDVDPDGLGIEVVLDIGRDGTYERMADTRGHPSIYCSPWATGNIAEGTPIRIQVCGVTGNEWRGCRYDNGVA